jgi:hypothetical protein
VSLHRGTFEQAVRELKDAEESDSLVEAIAASDYPRITETDDASAILTDDRDRRFAAVLDTILAGTMPPTQNSKGRGLVTRPQASS